MSAMPAQQLFNFEIRESGPDSFDVAGLVRRAADGDKHAWNRLVDQYGRLIWSITVKFKLAEGDAADVVQTTWMRLIEHIDRIEQPARWGPGSRRPLGMSACGTWRRANESCLFVRTASSTVLISTSRK